jgi:hypothetical protein
MPQLFRPSANTIFRAVLLGTVLGAGVLGYVLYEFFRSPYVTAQEVRHEQPIPFSHQHHVGILGFDCRYCHTSVEDSPFAGIPPTETCMNCHSQIWVGSEMLAPVRESWRTDQPLRWQRVHNLQQFVYFDHSIHVKKGVGCATCHGRVDQMPLTQQAAPLTMQWCLECHRDPAQFVRPRDKVFDMQWEPENQRELGKRLVEEYHIRSPDVLTSCSACHR